jgi:hypothetical protein
MSTPHTCPVCNGARTVSCPPWIAGDQQSWPASTAGGSYPCAACSGSGVVWEPDELTEREQKALRDAKFEEYAEAAQKFLDDLKQFREWFEKACAETPPGEKDNGQ